MAAVVTKVRIPPSLLVLIAVVSIQIGAAGALQLTHVYGVPGTVLMRFLWGGLFLLLMGGWRGARVLVTHPVGIGALACTLAFQNVMLLEALARNPVGVSVAVCFIGPFVVAVATSTRRSDWMWICVSAVGLCLLVPDYSHLDLVGLAAAALSGLGWASFILLSRRLGSAGGASVIATAMVLTAAILAPFVGFGPIEASLQFPWALGAGVVLGVFGAAIPISLEYRALGSLSPARYGVLVSTEPVVATAVGYVVLGQAVTIATLVGIVAIAGAAIGMAASGYRLCPSSKRSSNAVPEEPPRP